MKAVLICFVVLWSVPSDASAASDGAARLFTTKCSGCHTYGKGDLVGPDLKGTTERYSREWLIAWISSPERLIQSGDPTATALLSKYKIVMPTMGLSAGEVTAVLDFLAAGGPDAARARDRRAETATKDEIETGRSLFFGGRPLAGGGVACSACHRSGGTVGGTLGPNLQQAYSRFQDRALASFLARGCFPRKPGSAMTDLDAFAVRAFLRQAERGRRTADGAESTSAR